MTKAMSKAAATKKANQRFQSGNAKSKPSPIKRRAIARSAATAKVAKAAKLPTIRCVSKQAAVLGMLSSKAGTTIDAIVKAANRQSRSVRSFFASVVRKKLKLDLVSQRSDGIRIYRIADKPSLTRELHDAPSACVPRLQRMCRNILCERCLPTAFRPTYSAISMRGQCNCLKLRHHTRAISKF